MTWLYNNEPITEVPEGMLGFVYIITNNNNGKQYVGKKHFWSRRKKKTVESGWRKYYSSSPSLKKDLEEYEHKNFDREILHMCRSRAECSYWELHEQVSRQVLLKPDEYYNEWIMTKVHRKHLMEDKK